ncbi:biotin--[acetyl-CoA-carboxylase] ligase [Flavobacterium sp.]|uniref:biotin--[acetyl-CoA-carboxylase] ligase n=1 Tax=Flavobacterium sp. TaxID=239 RepID=UPI00286AA644|nr:biotin--[acetyl-CoA-carboxylase] ligase [Flavobacterium sp.]
MNLIKLDAIDSTNDFLKELSNRDVLENFTVVTAENQTNGKGQMGSVWASEQGKNLTMSILVKTFLLNTSQIYNLTIVVSLSVIKVLEGFNIPKLSIKWPNDIMSDHKKIGGVLIENTIKSDGTIISIVGLGLNVNQTNFESLPKASSLALICNSSFDKEEILFEIMHELKSNIQNWDRKSAVFITNYTSKLFKKGIPMPFLDQNNNKFMGIIQGISPVGKLQILLEDDIESEFDIKEIQMLY